MSKKLLFINPAGAHNVFHGWNYFFSHFFEFHAYNHDAPWIYGIHHHLAYALLLRIGKNFIALYSRRNIEASGDDILIVGDIFTNTLVYTLRGRKNIFYYSEFFTQGKDLRKKIFFRLRSFLFFRNRPFIVPTRLAEKTFQSISSKVFYLPQLYYGELYEQATRNDGKIRLLFIGRLSKKFKNIDFLIENYLSMKKTYAELSLTLVGELRDKDILETYKEYFDDGTITYLGKKPYDELHEIYTTHDIFVLPSESDPIGAVVQEAMAHGCAVMTSDYVGASGYLMSGENESEENGYVFKTGDAGDFQQKLSRLITRPDLLKKYKLNALEHIKKNYRVQNKEMCERRAKEISLFFEHNS